MLKEVLKKLSTTLLSYDLICTVAIHLLEYLVSKSENKIDDEIVAKVKEALKK